MSRRSFLGAFLASCLGLLGWFATPDPAVALGGSLPPLDEPAPEFSLPSNTDDKSVSLSDYRGQWVVVYFYPQDFTPGCTLEARRFQQDLPQYRDRNA